jgi:Ankyrin repeats (3 copies)
LPILDKLSVLFNLKDSPQEKCEKLFKAVENKNLAELRQFIESEKDAVRWKDAEGATALMIACKFGHGEIVERLLDAGAEINARDNAGVTGMGYAAMMGQQGIVKMLIERGADTIGSYAVAQRNGKTAIMEMINNADGVKRDYRREKSGGRIEVMKPLSLRQFKRSA